MLKSRSPTETRLFLRILPYLNGEYHVDEIIFRENVSRKELKEVVRYCLSLFFRYKKLGL
jgi:hypothetical protein